MWRCARTNTPKGGGVRRTNMDYEECYYCGSLLDPRDGHALCSAFHPMVFCPECEESHFVAELQEGHCPACSSSMVCRKCEKGLTKNDLQEGHCPACMEKFTPR